jgi:hypothetical protein
MFYFIKIYFYFFKGKVLGKWGNVFWGILGALSRVVGL